MAAVLRRLIAAKIIDPLIERIASRLADMIGPVAAAATAAVPHAPLPAVHEANGTPQDGDYVLWAYRLLLGREPEDPENLASHAYASDRQRLVQEFLNSDEFRRGKYVVDDALLVLPDGARYVLAEIEDGLRFWVNLHDEHVSRGIIGGMWEPTETAFIARHVTHGMNVIDIGANLGWFTVHMSRQVGPGGRVTAFEPRRDIHHYLARTVAENRLDNVVLHDCALGAHNGDGNIFWATTDLNPGGTHLVPPSVDPDALRDHYTFQPVSVRVLDEVVTGAVDFIKIDVEGAEKLIFEGASRILFADRPVIMSEIAPDSLEEVSGISAPEYLEFFEERGYVARTIEPDGGPGAVIRPAALDGDRNLINIALFPAERDACT